MAAITTELDLKSAVEYHYGQFPPAAIDYGKLMHPLSSASAALARYDQTLKNMHNSEILLSPLRRQEAVVSSRMEGTVSTLDEVLRYEADREDDDELINTRYRSEAIEVFLYHQAMKRTLASIQDGAPISDFLIRSAHRFLLSFGRGTDTSPGEYKTEQNYLVDRNRKHVLFIPISPERLRDGMEMLHAFINDDSWESLTRTALAHVEFEALHPFKDGNGRIGRMLITLMLWKQGVISAPHFYVSGYLEEQRDEYIDRMREVSRSGAWTEWCIFFFQALETQANKNLQVSEDIHRLYEEMKNVFREVLASQWHTTALDFIFSQPIFRNNRFTGTSGIPRPTAARFTRALVERGLLKTLEPASGRRPALYAFEPLLMLVRG